MVDPAIPISAALVFAVGAIATGWAQSKIGPAGAGVIAERPETFGFMLVFLALPETIVILGFVVASIMLMVLAA